MDAGVSHIEQDNSRRGASAGDDTSFSPKLAAPPVALNETFGFRLKNKLLGPALSNDRLIHERLGKPTALAVCAVV